LSIAELLLLLGVEGISETRMLKVEEAPFSGAAELMF
jgi:hypothetical protein